MAEWPDRRILDLLGIGIPIVQAPMAGASTPEMAVAVSEAGGLGSLACAQLGVDEARAALRVIRAGTSRPVNLNFFCHPAPRADDPRLLPWRQELAPYYVAQGLDPAMQLPSALRRPFDDDACGLVEEVRPEVVSFHLGLPPPELMDRVQRSGARVLGCATTVAEAVWLADRGCDAVIAMGLEAGGHRGAFLSDDMARQVGTFALVPQVADAVRVPVIAAGGIADARGIVAAFALGAAAVQMGTAYLFTSEARLSPAYAAALSAAADDDTVLTNVFTGRPARGIVNRAVRELGPLSPLTPPFPLAAAALGPLRARAEAEGSTDFTPLWSGQAARLSRAMPAGELTRTLAAEALARLRRR